MTSLFIRTRILTAALVACLIASSTPSIAQTTSTPSQTIPRLPSAPPVLQQAMPAETIKCTRGFLYQGKTLAIDSNLREDGENLRPIIHSVPDAVSSLNTYQSNQRQLQVLAYTGTLGLAAMLAGVLLQKEFGPSARTIGVGSGLILTGGSLLYGLSFLQANERHLGDAVRHYNQARPNDPIELQFSTGISF